MNHRLTLVKHRRFPLAAFVFGLPLIAGCASVQTYSFQRAPSPDRLPELAYDEVRKGRLVDHHDLLGPVQVELDRRVTAEFPVILERGRCVEALAVEEERLDPLRIAFLNEDFLEQDSAVGRSGVVSLRRCPESTENLILSVEGATKPVRVVVGVLRQP